MGKAPGLFWFPSYLCRLSSPAQAQVPSASQGSLQSPPMDPLFPPEVHRNANQTGPAQRAEAWCQCPVLPFATLRRLFRPWPQRLGPEAKGASPLPHGGQTTRLRCRGLLGTPVSFITLHTHFPAESPRLPHGSKTWEWKEGNDLYFTLSPPPCIFKHDSLPQGPDSVHLSCEHILTPRTPLTSFPAKVVPYFSAKMGRSFLSLDLCRLLEKRWPCPSHPDCTWWHT